MSYDELYYIKHLALWFFDFNPKIMEFYVKHNYDDQTLIPELNNWILYKSPIMNSFNLDLAESVFITDLNRHVWTMD